MKRVLVILFTFLSTSTIYTQDKIKKFENPNTVFTYYGFLTYQQFIVIAGSVYQSIFTTTEDDSVRVSYNMPGTFGAGYHRALTKRVSLGIDCNYSYAKILRRSNTDLSKNETSKIHFYDIGFLLNINYFQRKITTLYGGLVVGSSIINGHTANDVTHIATKETVIRPNWHINLIGVDVGKRVSGFMELGIGHKGLLNVGVRTRF